MADLKSIDLAKLVNTEQIVKVDENTAKRIKVVEETIDLEALRQEKESLEEQLNMPEPSQEELIELGKTIHPYYADRAAIEARISQIEEVLKNFK